MALGKKEKIRLLSCQNVLHLTFCIFFFTGPVLLQQRNSKGELPLDYVVSSQIKEELFAITKIEDTVENFHAQAEKHFYHQQLEFGSFLLSRMLLNFCSIFGLSSESFLAFKGLTHLSELLIACQNYK